MSAETLRKAASLMRERADGAEASHYLAMLHAESWAPDVTLAVADWIEAQADWSASGNPIPAQRGLGFEHALAVATAYLGSNDA